MNPLMWWLVGAAATFVLEVVGAARLMRSDPSFRNDMTKVGGIAVIITMFICLVAWPVQAAAMAYGVIKAVLTNASRRRLARKMRESE